jgi:hypothetical protein
MHSGADIATRLHDIDFDITQRNAGTVRPSGQSRPTQPQAKSRLRYQQGAVRYRLDALQNGRVINGIQEIRHAVLVRITGSFVGISDAVTILIST